MRVARGLFLRCGLASCITFTCYEAAAEDVSVRISGQHRLVYRYSDPVDLGLRAADSQVTSESLQLLRNTVQLEAQWSPAWRTVLQVGGWYALGDTERSRPPDVDLGDVSLAYTEWTSADVRIRLGRQELPLGSTRWFSTRDGANVRQSLDLLRYTLSKSHITLDLFAGLVPRLHRGWFDDLPDPQQPLLGMYSTLRLLPDKLLALDLYTLFRQRASSPSDAHYAGDRRTTLGMSLGGETPSGAEYIQHTLLQVGERNDVFFLAWGLSAAFWQRLPGLLPIVRLGLRLDALSGNRHAAGRHSGTFDPLFPNQTFFSPHPAIYPANLYSVHPMITVAHGGLMLQAGCIFLWRQSTSDGIYEANAEVTAVTDLPRAAHTGEQLSLQLEYELDEHFLTEVVFSRLFVGDAIERAGGSDVDFFGSTLSFVY